MKLSLVTAALLLLCGPRIVAAQDLDSAFQALKEAEGKKDAAEVKKLAAETCALARKTASTPAPTAEDEKAAWKSSVAHAKDVELYTEYALYATAIQSPPAATVDLMAALERQNPKSKYLDEGYARYFLALHQTGAGAKIPGIAEKAIANFPDHEDLLLVLTDSALNRKQSERALVYARRLTASINKHPKPDNISAADWERKRTAALGRGYWVAGMVASEKTQYAEANKQLRAALPLIKGNDAMLAPALYYLGVANYQLGKLTLNKAQVLEAVRFSEQSAGIESPFAEHARHNALVMKQDAGRMR